MMDSQPPGPQLTEMQIQGVEALVQGRKSRHSTNRCLLLALRHEAWAPTEPNAPAT